MPILRPIPLLVAALLLAVHPVAAGEPVLRPGTRLLIAGDSLTEQLQYSRMVEVYLRACHPALRVQVVQAGWGGEDMGGFQRRLEVAAGWFHPTAITMLYGMNDGCYLPPDEGRADKYAKALALAVDGARRLGAQPVVIAPGAVDTTSFDSGPFRRPGADAALYNQTLARLRDRAQAFAAQQQLPFGDLSSDLLAVMSAAKRRHGPRYQLLGGDGVHPGPNGHLAIAWTVLRALGADGDLGTITLDWTGEAAANGGHRIATRQGGTLAVDSDRYGYVGPREARSILADLPFARDLARLTLVVKNLPAPTAQVRWGRQEITASAEALAAGINLMERFEETPFEANLQRLAAAVERRQSFDGELVRGTFMGLAKARSLASGDAAVAAHADAIQTALAARWKERSEALDQEVATLRHTIEIVPQ